MNDIYLTKGDTGIGIKATLKTDEKITDFSNADVRFLFGKHEIYPDIQDDGSLLIVFDDHHTDKTGIFTACFKVEYSDSRIETYPDAAQDRIKVRIKE